MKMTHEASALVTMPIHGFSKTVRTQCASSTCTTAQKRGVSRAKKSHMRGRSVTEEMAERGGFEPPRALQPGLLEKHERTPHQAHGIRCGGGTGIRTLEPLAGLHALQACAIDRSAIPPCATLVRGKLGHYATSPYRDS